MTNGNAQTVKSRVERKNEKGEVIEAQIHHDISHQDYQSKLNRWKLDIEL